MTKPKEAQNPEEVEGKPVCKVCGSILIEEEGELVCPDCDGEIDFFGGEEDEEVEVDA